MCRFCRGLWKASRGGSRLLQITGWHKDKATCLRLVLGDASTPRLRFSSFYGMGDVSSALWTVILSNPEKSGLTAIQSVAKQVRGRKFSTSCFRCPETRRDLEDHSPMGLGASGPVPRGRLVGLLCLMLDLLGDTRFRTLRQLPGVREFQEEGFHGDSMAGATCTLSPQPAGGRGGHSLQTEAGLEHPQVVLQDFWQLHRLITKRSALEESLADTVTCPQRKAVLPSNEVIWALEEGAGNEHLGASGPGTHRHELLDASCNLPDSRWVVVMSDTIFLSRIFEVGGTEDHPTWNS